MQMNSIFSKVKKVVKWMFLLVVGVPVLFALGLFLIIVIFDPYFLQIDSCLGRGGRWDYDSNECEESSGVPAYPYACTQAGGIWGDGGCEGYQKLAE